MDDDPTAKVTHLKIQPHSQATQNKCMRDEGYHGTINSKVRTQNSGILIEHRHKNTVLYSSKGERRSV